MTPRKDGQKSALQKLLRDIIRTNRIGHTDPLCRHRLKGPANIRAQAVTAAQNLLATIQLKGRSRDWNPATKDTVADLRKIAKDMRLTADARMVACKRLAYLAGYADAPPLDEPLDKLIVSLVEAKPTVAGLDFHAIATAAARRGE